jgi:hypothetical protein
LGARRSEANVDLAKQFDPAALVPRLISVIENVGQVADESGEAACPARALAKVPDADAVLS